jgi:hypothetical protein
VRVEVIQHPIKLDAELSETALDPRCRLRQVELDRHQAGVNRIESGVVCITQLQQFIRNRGPVRAW